MKINKGFDAGFDNATRLGMIQKLNYEETKNGVTLKVLDIVGDFKQLWIRYELISNKGDKLEGELVSISSKDPNSIGVRYIDNIQDGRKKRYIGASFNNFEKDIILNINTNRVGTRKGIAEFKVPITLDQNKFNKPLSNIKLSNTKFKTDAGEIDIVSLKSSKTRTIIELKLNSSDYDFMGLDKPKLVDENGNEYEVSGSYSTFNKEGDHSIEFQGEVENTSKKLQLICGGMYFAPKKDREIIINLKEKKVQPNKLGISLGEINSNSLTLVGKGIKSISFDPIVDKSGKAIGDNNLWSSGVDDTKNNIEAYFTLDNIKNDEIKTRISWILKDKTGPVNLRLIE